MSATDLVVVLLGVMCLATAAAVVVLVGQVRLAVVELRRVVQRLESETLPAVNRMTDQADRIDAELRRVDGLVDTAEKVTARADTLSRATYHAVAKPVINTAAVVKGTSRAAKRLRGKV